MTAKEFNDLTKEDFGNDAVLSDIFYALRDYEDRIKELKTEKKKTILIAKEIHSYVSVGWSVLSDEAHSEINELWLRLKTLEKE